MSGTRNYNCWRLLILSITFLQQNFREQFKEVKLSVDAPHMREVLGLIPTAPRFQPLILARDLLLNIIEHACSMASLPLTAPCRLEAYFECRQVGCPA